MILINRYHITLWIILNGLFVRHDLCLVLSGSKVMIFFVIVCNVALLSTYDPFPFYAKEGLFNYQLHISCASIKSVFRIMLLSFTFSMSIHELITYPLGNGYILFDLNKKTS